MESGKLVRQQLTMEPAAAVSGDTRFLVPPSYGRPEHRDSALIDLWRLAVKHRWIIAATFVVVMVLTTVYSFRMTPLFQAVGQIAINRESNDVLGFKDVGNSDASLNDDYDYNVALDTQIRVLQSDSLAMQVIKELHLDANPYFAGKYANTPSRTETGAPRAMTPAEESKLLRNFGRSLEISKVPRTRVVQIRFLSPDPKLSAQVINTLVNTYIEQNFRTKYESTMQTTNWLSKQLTDLQMKVETSQQKLVDYQKNNEILGIDEKQNIITAKLNELNQQLTSAEGDRMQKQALYDLTKTGQPDALPGVTENHVIQKLKEQEADLKDQYAQATTRFGPSYPKVQELSNQLAQVEAALKNELNKVVLRIRNDYEESVARERMLRAALENQKNEANRLNERAIEYNLLKREVDTNRQLYEGLLQKMKEASVSAGLRSGNIRILDSARVPFRPTKPNIPFNLSVAALVGLALGVTFAYISDNLDNTIRDPDEVPAITGLQPLAVIPLSFPKTRKLGGDRKTITADAEKGESAALIAHNRPKSESAESYRALRTSILLSSFGTAPKVIVTTSGLPQEGKTTTSANTAIVLAQRGGRVLLVEADMRRPALSRLLNMKKHAGLSDLLAGIISMDQAIVPSPTVPNLDLIVAGTPPPNPAELLGSPTMKACLAQWRERYDHIVIDTPPVLTVTDAVLLSTEADAVLLVIRAGQTAQPALRRTRDLLNLVNARVVGVVVNALDLHANGYRYYNSYSGYSNYGRYNQYYQQDEAEAANN